MDSALGKKKNRRDARKARIRNKVRGTAGRPRVCVRITNKNIFVQMIDDESGRTLVSASTLGGEPGAKGKTKASAKLLGSALAEKAKAAGVDKAVFDRGGKLYHGRVRELAEAIREKGILM
jgi:large subunit ribosomal protein L18